MKPRKPKPQPKAKPKAKPKAGSAIRKRASRPNPKRPSVTVSPRTPPPGPRALAAVRELFWQNVIREMLTSLSALSAARSERPALPETPSPTPAPEAVPADGAPPEPEDLFDGRLAVITRLGQRIPIASVFPLFACGIEAQQPLEHALSLAVECTVFQIRTPGGEVFTLPLDEIRAFHALTPGLMRQLEDAAERQTPHGDDERLPFGFAAFTSLAQGGPSIIPEAPEHPTE